MDDMDIDPVFEGSNGPERMRGEVVGEFDIPQYNSRKASARKKYMHTRQWNDSGNQTVGSNSTKAADAENLSRRSRLAHLITKTLDMEPHTRDDIKETEQTNISDGSGRNMTSLDAIVKISSPGSHHSRHRGSRKKKGKERLPVFDEGDITLEARDKGKTVALADGAFASRRSHSVWQRKPEHSAYLSPCNISRNGNSNDGNCLDNSVNFGLCSSHVAVGGKYRMKETDSDNIAHQPDPGPGIPRHNQLDAVQMNSGPRKLVQTDGVSPYNMVHAKNHAKGNWVRKLVHSELSEGALAHQTPIPDSEGRHGDRRGKLLVDDNFINDNQQGKAKPHFGRVRSVVGKEVEDWGWRKTHDLTNKAPVSLQESPTVSKRGKGTYNCVPDQGNEIATGYRDHANHLYESQRWKKKLMKSKRKNNSVHSSYGGCSSSTIEGPETSNLRSSGHFPNPELTIACDSKHIGTVFAPTTVVDEMEPTHLTCSLPEQSGRTPVDSSTKVSQVESDEILARQLQEQFYHELEGFRGSEEADASIEWSLQHDDSQQSASLARSPFNHRDTSMAHLYSYYARLPQSTNRGQAPMSSRRDNYGLEMDFETRMMAEVRRSFNSAQMGRETRHNLLEALEAAFDNSNDMFSENVLHTRRDFNESDYEMLLTLDENNHYNVGASEDQIDSLPVSLIQSDTIQEACAICLETPSVGDVIRPLPCLHKFHKECVDTWLRRKSSCPVCKSDVII